MAILCELDKSFSDRGQKNGYLWKLGIDCEGHMRETLECWKSSIFLSWWIYGCIYICKNSLKCTLRTKGKKVRNKSI